MRRSKTLPSFWFDAVRIGLDAQAVIGLRLMQAATGRASARENTRMVSEKLIALAEAQQVAALALATAGPVVAAERVLRVYRKAIGANRRRLGRS